MKPFSSATFTIVTLASLIFPGLAPIDAAAAEVYPVRPVRIIVAYAPGGGSDQLARLIAPQLTRDFGQQFVVDNRPGGNTLIAMRLLVEAAPDGYTLGVVDAAFAINPALIDKLPYDTRRAFAPVTLLGTSPLEVRRERIAHRLNAFIADCHPNPTSPLTFVHQGSQPFLPKPENLRRRTKPEKVRRF